MPARRETSDEPAQVVTEPAQVSPQVSPEPRDVSPEPGAAPGPVDQAAAAAREDRWHWRRRVRANPTQHRLYRILVAIAGLLLIVLGLVTGPIPGPGGIPLVLLGLAVWASEFVWAHRVMHVFKGQVHRYQRWSRPRQVGFWAVFLAVCGLCGYAFMVLTGVPQWVPASADALLQQLPGL
jgi:uncharacterized protein (TIGR02611 family)